MTIYNDIQYILGKPVPVFFCATKLNEADMASFIFF